MIGNGSMRAAAALLSILAAGCWNSVDEHCRRCTIVRERAPRLAPAPPATHAVVILVHGAFGFGREWTTVRGALAEHRRARSAKIKE